MNRSGREMSAVVEAMNGNESALEWLIEHDKEMGAFVEAMSGSDRALEWLKDN